MKKFILTNQVLHKDILFIIDCPYEVFKKEIKEYNMSQYKIDIPEAETAFGCNYRGDNGISTIWVKNKLPFAKFIGCLTHEILHAVVWQFHTVDIPLYWENDEILCYTQEYFFIEALKIMYPNRK